MPVNGFAGCSPPIMPGSTLAELSLTLVIQTCSFRGYGADVNFVVIPIGRNPKFGFWLQAADSGEARKLVSLNVPGMAGVTDLKLAHCTRDDSYSPMHGVILEGSGRSYTITRRRGDATLIGL